MYTYFALQTIGVKPPKGLSMSITILQILQMVGGIIVLSKARSMHQQGKFCQVPDSVIRNGFLIYSSYFALFVHFFLEAYVFGKKNILNTKKGENVNNNVVQTDLNNNKMTTPVQTKT
jgi:elongation of very long chain fatty acids protein 6